MNDMWKQYEIFTSLFHSKGGTTACPTVFMRFYADGNMEIREPLVAMTIDDVKDAFDLESRLVQCLLQQMTTYDSSQEKILALAFDRHTVLSVVMRVE
jgi:hypothetical protein